MSDLAMSMAKKSEFTDAQRAELRQMIDAREAVRDAEMRRQLIAAKVLADDVAPPMAQARA